MYVCMHLYNLQLISIIPVSLLYDDLQGVKVKCFTVIVKQDQFHPNLVNQPTNKQRTPSSNFGVRKFSTHSNRF